MKALGLCMISCAFCILQTKPLIAAEQPLPSPTDTTPSTWCRFVPERMDDFAWENDLIAFRAYGPAITKNHGTEGSGIDCWPKRVTYPIVDRWYAGSLNHISYHIDRGEGGDNYHVGASLGCGGDGIWQDGKLVQAGPYKEWRIVSRKRDKSVFELTYDYLLGGKQVHEVKRITIELGKRLFLIESTFTQDGMPAALNVAIGITTHDGKALASYSPAKTWMSCWENIDGFGFGTGVVIAPGRAKEMFDMKSTSSDQSHALLIAPTDADGKVSYYAGYGWDKGGTIRTQKQWNDYLAAFARSISTQ